MGAFRSIKNVAQGSVVKVLATAIKYVRMSQILQAIKGNTT